MQKIIIIFLLYQFSFAQEIKISGIVKSNTDRSIESASVVVLDNIGNTLLYIYTDEKGYYSLVFDKPNTNVITIIVSSLGYTRQELKVDISSRIIIEQSFTLDEKTESLNEVIIESDQKIKIDRDTTTIKIAKFSNKTELTVEDILRKLPGIEVLKDGSIKAHGKAIDKLLVEGEDIFDKNYKLLSKNLDANFLDAVQIIDGFEDNPILKKLSNSDKIALNLKLKKDKQNIWFGNIIVGSGVVSENRWKEGLNIGLLRKKIKLFYLADYNNSGEKATDQLVRSINENNTFNQERYEKTAKTLFNINSNENTLFSKSQSIINKAFFNSLTFTAKIKPKLTLRGVAYFAVDEQIQNSFSETKYNLISNPISYKETNNYIGEKILSSGEIELKYFANEDNYFTNNFIYKNNPIEITDNLIFNSDKIKQDSKNKNKTFYNHFNHTFSLSENKILTNYIYVGQDSNCEQSEIVSPFLNQFLNKKLNALVKQKADNSIVFFGLKSKLISKYRKLFHIIGLQLENNKEIFNNNFEIDSSKITDYENSTVLKQSFFSIENNFRYNFTKKIELTVGFNFIQNKFNNNEKTDYIPIFNSNISFSIKKTNFGSFVLSYTENSNVPEINYLTNNTQLTDYRSFSKGMNYEKPLKNNSISFLYHFYNDEKRFSVGASLFYLKSKNIVSTENTITNNFTFSNYVLNKGGDSFNSNFNIINYLRILKLATKLETSQNWTITPVKVNENTFNNLKSYNSSYKFSGTTYFKLLINFDFGFEYNFGQSILNNSTSKNITKNAFININYKITKTLLGELNTTFYELNKTNYSFINAVINYTPEKSRLSYRLVLNNLNNENEFTLISLDNYTSYKSSINLVPRYLLLSIKYRF